MRKSALSLARPKTCTASLVAPLAAVLIVSPTPSIVWDKERPPLAPTVSTVALFVLTSNKSEVCDAAPTMVSGTVPGFVPVIVTGGVNVALIVTAAKSWSRTFTDRKSTRLNSSHLGISYAVFCLKKKTYMDGTACRSLRRRTSQSHRRYLCAASQSAEPRRPRRQQRLHDDPRHARPRGRRRHGRA